jgi:hypothetical protein
MVVCFFSPYFCVFPFAGGYSLHRRINQNPDGTETVTKQVIGKSKLGTMFRDMCKEAGVEGEQL